MRTSVFRTSLLVLILVLARARAADSDSIMDWKKVSEIHLPAEMRCSQLAELVRQLGVSAFIDFGYGWKDGEEEGAVEGNNWPLASFSFKAGSVSTALNAYCTTHPFVWHYWPEADAIWLEPKKPELRLSHQIADRLPEWSLTEIKDVGLIMSDKELLEKWMAARKTACHFWTNGGWSVTLNGIGNYRKLPLSFIKNFNSGVVVKSPANVLSELGTKSPENVREYIGWWLRLHSRSVVGLLSRKVNAPDNTKFEPALIMGSTPEELELMPIQLVVQNVIDFEWKPNSIPPEFFRQELFRRSQFDMPKLVEAIKQADKEYKSLSKMSVLFKTDWNPGTMSELIYALFTSAPKEVQLKVLRDARILPNPVEYGASVLKPWQELSKSNIPEFRLMAQQELNYFEEKLKQPTEK